MHRLAAAAVALAAWAGLGLQFAMNLESSQTVVEAIWTLLRFFTIITNLLVALTMTAVAAGRRVSPFILAGLTLAIVFVGAIYVALLHGLVELTGRAILTNALLHYVVPLAMAFYWLAFAPKIGLGHRDPLRWSVYPLLYLAYVIVRGSIDGRYPYPFIDVSSLGYGRTVLNSLLLLIVYLLAGLVLVVIGRALARRRGARGPIG